MDLPPSDTRIALIRGRVRERLGWRASAMGETLLVDDAREFVAHAEGATSWEQLKGTN
jgi:hypothetical protein